MNINERELANLLERFWVKHLEFLEKEQKMVLPKKKRDKEDYLMEITPADMDYREYAELILGDIRKLKKWIY